MTNPMRPPTLTPEQTQELSTLTGEASRSATIIDMAPEDAVEIGQLPKYSMRAVLEVGRVLAKSHYFSDAHQMMQAVAKILAGAELGIGPVASMTGVYIVKGRIVLSANIYAALIRRSPDYDYRIKTLTRTLCEIDFVDKHTGEILGTSDFSIEDAKQAGLLAASTAWKAYPRNMLFARALSNGARFYCPDVGTMPLYVPDELGMLDPQEDDDQRTQRKALPAPELEFVDGEVTEQPSADAVDAPPDDGDPLG